MKHSIIKTFESFNQTNEYFFPNSPEDDFEENSNLPDDSEIRGRYQNESTLSYDLNQGSVIRFFSKIKEGGVEATVVDVLNLDTYREDNRFIIKLTTSDGTEMVKTLIPGDKIEMQFKPGKFEDWDKLVVADPVFDTEGTGPKLRAKNVKTVNQ